jgi:hypothetical protein
MTTGFFSFEFTPSMKEKGKYNTSYLGDIS